VIIYFATWLADKSLGDSLTKKKGNNRLMSYHFLREQLTDKEGTFHAEKLEHYCRFGRVNLAKK
jgi:hypothetical protein